MEDRTLIFGLHKHMKSAMESLNAKYFVLGDPRHLHDQTYRRPASSIGRRKGSPVRAICCALVLLAFAFPAAADILDFEGLPSAYMFLGGGQNVDFLRKLYRPENTKLSHSPISARAGWLARM